MESQEAGNIHISQFNALFSQGILLNTVVNTPPIEISGLKLSFTGLEIHRPFRLQKGKNIDSSVSDCRLLPKECREQSLTYGGRIFIKMKLEYNDAVIFDEYRPAGIFPVMLRSSICNVTDAQNMYELGEDPLESGGYFIIDGYDRLIRFHIAPKRNYLFAVRKKSKDRMYTDYSISIRSVSEEQIGQKCDVRYCADGNIHVKVFLNTKSYNIPIVLLLRALVNCTDEEIFTAVGGDQRILAVLARMKDYSCYSQIEAIEYLGVRFRPILKIDDHFECGKLFLDSLVLPHLNKSEDKFQLFIEAIKKLFKCYDGLIQPDNIDSPSNFELFTELQLFPLCFREKLLEVKRSFMSKVINLLRNKVSTSDSTTSFSISEALELTGSMSDFHIEKIKKIFDTLDIDIGLKLKRLVSMGVITTACCSDMLQRNSFSIIAERINMWRFSSHFASVSRGAYFANIRVSSIRKLKPESWGFFCPVNTPDGTPCGLLMHLTQACHVSDRSYALDDSVIYEFGVIPTRRGYNGGTRVFYNGKLVGTIEEADAFVRSLRNYRALNGICVEIHHEYGVDLDNAVWIFDTVSSLYRRVFNTRLQKEEWIGMKEQVFLNISLSPYVTKDSYNKYDKGEVNFEYREIDNAGIFSSIASSIPFAEHNPSPRNIYQCQMAKQAVGIPAYNRQFRTDNKNFQVYYLQSPIVTTSSYNTFLNYPIGFNCMVAIISYTAYDMEDAVVINKSASDRGLFNAFVHKNEKFVLEKGSSIDYTPFKGTRVEEGDVLVRYTHPDLGTKVCKYESSESGFVEIVRLFHNDTPCVTISIRIPRNPVIGDKFCSRHGQKGICSMFWPDIDMPFTESGLKPDILINPHAFPSRMTIGMILESIAGKSALVFGEKKNATPFVKNQYFEEGDPKSMGEELRRCGFNYYGNEPMYSGITGTEFRTDIFIGPVYYQRLRHMVNDKYQVRTSGEVVSTTRQPVGGRKNKGGIRFGEMEKDTLIAHGVASTLQDRLMNCSDRTEFTYCSSCKTILFTGKGCCSCGCRLLKKVVMPYVFKYLCCELMAMNVKMVFDVS